MNVSTRPVVHAADSTCAITRFAQSPSVSGHFFHYNFYTCKIRLLYAPKRSAFVFYQSWKSTRATCFSRGSLSSIARTRAPIEWFVPRCSGVQSCILCSDIGDCRSFSEKKEQTKKTTKQQSVFQELPDGCCVAQVSYAIGISEPLSIYLTSYGTSKLSDQDLLAIVNDNFDLRPGIIVK